MRLRCLILSTVLLGMPAFGAAQVNPPTLHWEHDPVQTKLSFLSWDTEGRGAASRNLLRIDDPPPETSGLRLAAKINGGPNWIDTHGLFRTLQAVPGGWSYRISMGNGITLVWTITEEPGAKLVQSFSVVETEWGRVDALQLRFLFNPHTTFTAVVPGSWASDDSLRPPVVISAADFGQMYLETSRQGQPDPDPGLLERGILAGKRNDVAPWSYVALNFGRPDPPLTVTLRPHYLDRPPLVTSERAWNLARRGWWNAFQPSSAWSTGAPAPRSVPSGILANNTISVPCALALQFYADSAYWVHQLYTPMDPAAPGISAATQVRRTVDWWIDRWTTYSVTQSGISVGKVEGCVPPGSPPYYERRFQLDGNPAVIISAWDYVEATGDQDWLLQRYNKLQQISAYLEVRRDSDGLVKCDNSGLPGHLYNSADRACGWFDVVGSGHKDAYVNAFVYRAWRAMATLAARLSRPGDQAYYTALANQLKAGYRPAFYDQATSWLAWWVDSNGIRHNYASIVVNGLAIEYGLIEPAEGRLILEALRAALAVKGFERFDLGVPHVLDTIRRVDYVPGTPGYPHETDPDGLLMQGVYENAGITAGHVLHFLAAHYVVGDPEPAEAILWPMLHRLHAGGFQNGGPRFGGQAVDWTNWKGAPSGYEGLLADVYRLPQAVLLREPAARQAFYRHLYPVGTPVPEGAPTPPDPPLPPPPTCASVKPYDGRGVTAAWEDETGKVFVASGDKYWQLISDPGVPGGLAFQGAGYIDDLPDWSTAPRVRAVLPWDCDGVAAVSRNVVGGGLHIMTSDRWWELRANGSWGVGDSLKTMWEPSGLLPVGGRLPWDAPGITASWATTAGSVSVRTYVSKDRYWRRTYTTATGWTWTQGYVSALWPSAPPQNGVLPWTGDGVTAVFQANGWLWIINKDRYWQLNETTGTWPASGLLSSIWSGAPQACGSPPQGVIPPGDSRCTAND